MGEFLAAPVPWTSVLSNEKKLSIAALSQMLPKRDRLHEIGAVAAALNTKPRKTRNWKTLAEALDGLLRWANNQPRATTACKRTRLLTGRPHVMLSTDKCRGANNEVFSSVEI